MVEATAQARIEARRSASIQTRRQLTLLSVGTDAVTLLASMLIADATLARVWPNAATQFTPLYLPAILLALIGIPVFYASGLYELEAYVSRPLHLWTLLKAAVITFGLTALGFYIFNPNGMTDARFVIAGAFGVFVVLSSMLRIVVIDRLSVVWLKQRRSVSLLIGELPRSTRLANRLEDLRGFDIVEKVDVSGEADITKTIDSALERHPTSGGRVAAVFVDVESMTPEQAYRAATVAQKLGAEVYMVSHLLDAVEGGRMLTKLFEAPVVRLRGRNERETPYVLKRAFDIVGSAALLLVAAPVIAALGAIIKLTSPGPVFYKQLRVGQSGTTFEFLKLRSMVVNDQENIHSEYVKQFMHGNAETFSNGNGDAVFKKLDDPRITPIGRFIRKFSLDELPQFWNVFRGDMSLVGPRPALPYEVAEYNDFDRLRMRVPAGITGLWQVKGRSRVSFDEMILQDLVYAQNARLIVDLELCLSTLPAALLGGGGG